MKVCKATVSVVWMGLMISPAFGQTAGTVGFQALIKDAEGDPIEVPVDLEFRIYDAEVAGNLVDMDGDGVVEDACGEDATCVPAVTPTNGSVATKFGPIHPSAFDGNRRWLEVRVETEPLSRVEMVTAPATSEQVNIPGSGTAAIEVDASGNVSVPGTIQAGSSITIDGTANTINSSGDLELQSAGTTRIYVDEVTGNVGIGTTNPERVLHTLGDAVLFERAVNEAGILLKNTFDGPITAGWALNSTGPGTGFAYLTDQALQRVIILSDGNMGVGEGAISNRLTVNGDADFTGNVGIGTAAPTSALDVAGGNVSLNGGWLSGDGENEGVFVLDNGKVGIGTTFPESTFGVAGGIRVEGTIRNAGGLTLSGGGSGVAIEMDEDDGSFDSFIILDTGVERFRVDGDTGNVGIGTASPATKLDVDGTVTATAFSGDGSDLTGIIGDASYGSSAGSPDDAVFVDDAGLVGIGTNEPSSTLEINTTVSGVPSLIVRNSMTGSGVGPTARFVNDLENIFQVGLLSSGDVVWGNTALLHSASGHMRLLALSQA